MNNWSKGLFQLALWALSLGAFGWMLTSMQLPSLPPTQPTQAQLEAEAEFIAIRDSRWDSRCR